MRRSLQTYWVVLMATAAVALTGRAGECKSDVDCAAGSCCSQFGYCGSGPDYCRDGQGNDSINRGLANGSIYRFGDASQCNNLFRKYGACGISTYYQQLDTDSSLVAMPAGIFDLHCTAQNNALCGKMIMISHNGVTRKAVVADRNLSADDSIDMCLNLWTAFGGHDNDGTVIHGMSFNIQPYPPGLLHARAYWIKKWLAPRRVSALVA